MTSMDTEDKCFMVIVLLRGEIISSLIPGNCKHFMLSDDEILQRRLVLGVNINAEMTENS